MPFHLAVSQFDTHLVFAAGKIHVPFEDHRGGLCAARFQRVIPHHLRTVSGQFVSRQPDFLLAGIRHQPIANHHRRGFSTALSRPQHLARGRIQTGHIAACIHDQAHLALVFPNYR